MNSHNQVNAWPIAGEASLAPVSNRLVNPQNRVETLRKSRVAEMCRLKKVRAKTNSEWQIEL